MADSGGIEGWNEVKQAFRTRNPNAEQRSKISWAKECSFLGDRFDPFAEPDTAVTNQDGRWKNCIFKMMRGMGENVKGLDRGEEHAL